RLFFRRSNALILTRIGGDFLDLLKELAPARIVCREAMDPAKTIFGSKSRAVAWRFCNCGHQRPKSWPPPLQVEPQFRYSMNSFDRGLLSPRAATPRRSTHDGCCHS